jgi:hypothetical protein
MQFLHMLQWGCASLMRADQGVGARGPRCDSGHNTWDTPTITHPEFKFTTLRPMLQHGHRPLACWGWRRPHASLPVDVDASAGGSCREQQGCSCGLAAGRTPESEATGDCSHVLAGQAAHQLPRSCLEHVHGALHAPNNKRVGCWRPCRPERRHPAPRVVVVLDQKLLSPAGRSGRARARRRRAPHPQRVVKGDAEKAAAAIRRPHRPLAALGMLAHCERLGPGAATTLTGRAAAGAAVTGRDETAGVKD